MPTFSDLVDSRKAWIADVLLPWCRAASRKDLLRAEQEWTDIAGKIAPERSLWLWAWSRFPALYTEGLGGLDETWPVQVTLADGRQIEGYPDNRESLRGELVVQTRTGSEGPFSLDNVQSIERLAAAHE